MTRKTEGALAAYTVSTETGEGWEATAHLLAEALKLTVKTPRPPRAKKPIGFDMTAEGLSAAMAILVTAVWPHNTIPVLSTIDIEQTALELILTTTDLDRFIRVVIPNPGEKKFTAAVDAHGLARALKAMSGPVEMKFNPTNKTLVVGGHTFTADLDPSDFPTPHENNVPGTPFKIAASDLSSMIDFVTPAISSEETRYYLNGAFLGAIEDKLRLVATDGHRLNVAMIDRPEGAECFGVGAPAHQGRIIPRESVKTLRAFLGAIEGEVSVRDGNHYVTFEAPQIRLMTKFIDGKFPDYPRVIPDVAKTRHRWLVDPVALDAGVKSVMATNRESGAPCNFFFPPTGTDVTLHTASLNGSSAEQVIAFEELRGGAFKFGANAFYVREVLALFKNSALICMETVGDVGIDPILLTDPTNPNRLSVLMPVKMMNERNLRD